MQLLKRAPAETPHTDVTAEHRETMIDFELENETVQITADVHRFIDL